MKLHAQIWYKEHRLEEAKAEVLCVTNVFERLVSTKNVEKCRIILQDIEEEEKKLVASGEFLETVLSPTPVNSLFLAHGTE